MISINIRKFREKAGMTQEALARKADISYNTLVKLESGAVTNPRMDNLMKLADGQPLKLNYTLGAEGNAEIHSLKGAEWAGGHVMPQGDALWSRFRAACDRFFERRKPDVSRFG